MCGRFAFYSPAEATAALFGAETVHDFKPRFNIAPTQDIAAIRRSDTKGVEMTSLRWGLVPFWAKDPSIGNRMINARAETVAEKPSFRTAFRKRRCLIPADGFYEWHTDAGQKTPWFISLASNEPFAFAGLWESWSDKETGETLETATIITTAANDFMSRLHHRMPVVTAADKADDWLQGAEGALEKLIGNSPRFRAWPVDRRVNNARNEGRELIDAAGDTISA
ncbi:MAG: SOS response-associated peptidase [Gammaproteobacteria bacterium]|nr:SOS response-associated peptidase [Gammaproteobacteria bacterium]MDH4313479.1 SOS response-associated peptidase [Gammaproteobacteria bacterium]MDH5213055.1 SOS response-associated peptidase [Gammaproteobacteria bacterium]